MSMEDKTKEEIQENLNDELTVEEEEQVSGGLNSMQYDYVKKGAGK